MHTYHRGLYIGDLAVSPLHLVVLGYWWRLLDPRVVLRLALSIFEGTSLVVLFGALF